MIIYRLKYRIKRILLLITIFFSSNRSFTQKGVRCCKNPSLDEVGFDIWPGGEEKQYECTNCRKIVCHVFILGTGDFWTWPKSNKKGK